ncbi:MAG: DUF2812 domain-containing protein [Lachnospiraceae bacterium]|nr:DUF2812 domain-containing protein [Lachnospiraceae bacterium]
MSIVKRRYFAGCMERQAKWLNSMSDKGYRLIKTGKLKYEFEECTPGAYRYAVEYVGDKSFEEEQNYKEFLEDLGYKVFYKNINLDWSLYKVSVRPWADKGGKISTNSTTYNKELLIVEKENDGKPFELHTDKEDLSEYYRRLSYPWYFAVFFMLAMLILAWPYVVPVALFGAFAVICAIPIIIAAVKIKKIKKESEVEE